MIAAFIDRDGTINEDTDLLTKKEQIRIIPGAIEGIKILNGLGILAIIVTNQPVVARNLITEDELKEINQTIIAEIRKGGGKIDAVYYCPHHPEKNHPEANDPKYRRECKCRKPSTGMIKQATKRFKINTQNSYVIGDRTVDIRMAKNAGCKSILVKTGSSGKDGKYKTKPDYTCKNLLEAAKLIKELIKK